MPDSARLQGLLRKAAAGFIGFVLALVLLVALLTTGFYMLVNAATLALAPFVGEVGALAVTGLSCLLLLASGFYLLTRPPAAKKSGDAQQAQPSESSLDAIRGLVRNNPLEAAAAAFTLGVVEQSDPRLKSIILQGGMALAREAEAEQARARNEADAPGEPTPRA
tara:strand:- start:20793 stop:21287 length:495 start_codon:yes stop_codon:yes gene_type:complete